MAGFIDSRIKPGEVSGMCIVILIFIFSYQAFALQPLMTDDTGTQGKGVFQLAFHYQYSRDRYSETARDPKELLESESAGQSSFGKLRVNEDINHAGISLTYGIIDSLDIAIGIPYYHVRTLEKLRYYTGPLQGLCLREGETVTGLSDIAVESKWKFYEYKSFSLALKPGISLPAGNEDRGLGMGKLGAYGYFISTIDLTPVIMHLNFGYIRNQNRINEREDIWHASMAWELWLAKDCFRLVANAGLERNRDKRSNVHDAFLLAGFIGSPTNDCDLDFGFKYGIQSKHWKSPGPDYSVIAGATIWFGWTPAHDKGVEKKDNGDEKRGVK